MKTIIYACMVFGKMCMPQPNHNTTDKSCTTVNYEFFSELPISLAKPTHHLQWRVATADGQQTLGEGRLATCWGVHSFTMYGC